MTNKELAVLLWNIVDATSDEGVVWISRAEVQALKEAADALELERNPTTFGTEYGVQYPPTLSNPLGQWAAEDEHEARGEAMGHGGKMIKRAVGPWEVVE
jgi:hypothetical protein